MRFHDEDRDQASYVAAWETPDPLWADRMREREDHPSLVLPVRGGDGPEYPPTRFDYMLLAVMIVAEAAWILGLLLGLIVVAS